MEDKRVLFIRYKKSRGVFEGGEQASQKHYEALCREEGTENITIYYIHDEGKKKGIGDYVAGMLFFFCNYYFGLTPWRLEKIVKKATHYDVVFIDRSVFGIIAKKLKQRGYKGRVISFYHNVEKLYFAAKLDGKPWKGLVARCASQNDRYAAEYSDATVTLNKRDERILDEEYGLKQNYIIPVTFDDRLDPFDEHSGVMTCDVPNCLFLGSYFPANVDGILWFVKEVMPRVNVRLTIAGKGMSRLMSQLKAVADAKTMERIKLLSDVENLAPLFIDADAVVLPIFKGSGMKVKTCESLMFGKHIYGTDEAFEGYDVDFDKVGGLCNTADEFAEKLDDLRKHPRMRLNEYSRQTYLTKYTDEAVEEMWGKVIDKD